MEMGQQGPTPWDLDLEHKDQNKTKQNKKHTTNQSSFIFGEMTQMCPISFCTYGMFPLPP